MIKGDRHGSCSTLLLSINHLAVFVTEVTG
jgi:hypothetical protein